MGGDNKIYHGRKMPTGGWGDWTGLGFTQDITFQQVVLRTSGGTITPFGLVSDGSGKSDADIMMTSRDWLRIRRRLNLP